MIHHKGVGAFPKQPSDRPGLTGGGRMWRRPQGDPRQRLCEACSWDYQSASSGRFDGLDPSTTTVPQTRAFTLLFHWRGGWTCLVYSLFLGVWQAGRRS